MLNKLLNLFLENDQALKKAFIWEQNLIKKNAAFQLAVRNQQIDIERIKDMIDYMKEKTSAFSYFRHCLFPIAALLSTQRNGQQLFDLTIQYYEDLKEEKFRRSTYLPYVAFFLASEVQPTEAAKTIEKAAQMYKIMKENNYWLTSDDDYMLAVLLAHSGIEPSHAANEMTECYRYLNERGIWKGNALQTMSHILGLSNEPVYKKCDRLLEYQQLLKDEKIKLDSYSRSLLAVLSIVDSNVNSTVHKITETDRALSSIKGFGNWSLGRGSRNMFSVALTLSEDVQKVTAETLQATVQNSIQSLLLAQQAVMIAGIAAATASSNSSSSD